MAKDVASAVSACICIFFCILPLLLGIITGVIFLDFYVGWAVQWNYFNSTGNALSLGYEQLFVSPPVSDSWSIFSCFLFGFLIIKGCAALISIFICICCGCCTGCCVALNADKMESTSLMDLSEIKIPHYDGI